LQTDIQYLKNDNKNHSVIRRNVVVLSQRSRLVAPISRHQTEHRVGHEVTVTSHASFIVP
jgi:hypothetical protein